MKYIGRLKPHINGYTRQAHLTLFPYNYGGCLELAHSKLDEDDEFIEIETDGLREKSDVPFQLDDHFMVFVEYYNNQNKMIDMQNVSVTNLTEANFLVRWWHNVTNLWRTVRKVKIKKAN